MGIPDSTTKYDILKVLEAEEPLTVTEISVKSNILRTRVQSSVSVLEKDGIIGRLKKPNQKDWYYYRLNPNKAIEDTLIPANVSVPITKGELIRAAKRCKIGDRIRVLNDKRWNRIDDSWGMTEMGTVVAKYPFLVRLNNGICVSYAQLAAYYRANSSHKLII